MSTWIFLRGLTRESRHWGDFPDVFKHAVADANVVAVDLPGNGSLHRRRSPATIEAMARLCRDELQARKIDPPYYLLAMSLGAMVAVAWADAHPDDVAGCVLINTSLQPFSRFYQRLRPHNYGALLKLTLFDNSDRETERRIFALTSRLADPPAGVLETWVRCRREHPVSRSNTLRQLLAATRYRAPQAKPATQMLVLCSAGDTLVDPHCSRQLARTWMTDFAEHPTAGHDIPLDDDKWVAQRVNDWLTRASPAPQKT